MQSKLFPIITKTVLNFKLVSLAAGIVAVSSWAENLSYSGKVVDAMGIALPWALIHVEGGATVVQSDANGNFTLTESGTLALYPDINPNNMLPKSLEKKTSTPLFIITGRNIPVTHHNSAKLFFQATASQPSLDQSKQGHGALSKVSASYNIVVSKAHYQTKYFSQSLASATNLNLILLASSTDTALYAVEKKICLDTINACRKSLGLSPVVWSKSLEAFADEGARYDAGTNVAHSHFSKFSTRAVPADAENLVPNWPLKNYKTVTAIVQKGTALMWAEGPGGGHYENIKGNQTQVGCGIYVTPAGNVWMTQDFK